MKVEKEHIPLLKSLGLTDEDMERFDGEFVRYEYDPEKGVRLYDPYYSTSYDEYIDSDGWSAWSSEEDTFMSDILRGAREKAEQKAGPPPGDEEIADAMRKKFGGKKDEGA